MDATILTPQQLGLSSTECGVNRNCGISACVVVDKVNVEYTHTHMYDPQGECVFEQDTPGGQGNHLVTHTHTYINSPSSVPLPGNEHHPPTHTLKHTHSLPSTLKSLLNEKTNLCMCMFLLSDGACRNRKQRPQTNTGNASTVFPLA